MCNAILLRTRSLSLKIQQHARAGRREQGSPKVTLDLWTAIFLPKETPEPIIRRLNQAASETLDTPSVRDRWEGLGVRVLLRSDIEKWADRIKAAGIAG
jgi:tripartite-type tricarboxylate transporter receptor subunit TctC